LLHIFRIIYACVGNVSVPTWNKNVTKVFFANTCPQYVNRPSTPLGKHSEVPSHPSATADGTDEKPTAHPGGQKMGHSSQSLPSFATTPLNSGLQLAYISAFSFCD
jgi:hypothetical protein